MRTMKPSPIDRCRLRRMKWVIWPRNLAFVFVSTSGFVYLSSLTTDWYRSSSIFVHNYPAIACPCGGYVTNVTESFVRHHQDCIKSDIFCSRAIYNCPNSSIMFTHPLPSDDELAKAYATSYDGQASLRVGHPRVSSQSQFIRKHAGAVLFEGLRILEIGCAGGFLLQQFAADDNQLICFESGPKMHDEFRKTFENYTNVLLHKTTFHRDRFKEARDSNVDLIMSSHAFEHASNPCELLEAFYEIMKPGALMFHEVPQQSREEVTAVQGGLYHLTFWSPDSLRWAFEKAGFEVVVIQTFSSFDDIDHTGKGKWIRALLRKPLHRSITDHRVFKKFS